MSKEIKVLIRIRRGIVEVVQSTAENVRVVVIDDDGNGFIDYEEENAEVVSGNFFDKFSDDELQYEEWQSIRDDLRASNF